MPFFRFILAAAVAAPLCVVTLYLSSIAAAERAGATLLAARAPGNLAEAAGSARADVVVRLLRGGDDPTRVQALHPDVISSVVLRATALEAAVWSRRVDMIELLDREQAIPDARTRTAMACLARDIGVEEIVAYLSPAGPPECVPGQALKDVEARSMQTDIP